MIFGLIGKKLSHSFSKSFFEDKFTSLNLPHEYKLFEIDSASAIHRIKEENPNLIGLNVTIPFKQDVLQYLDDIDSAAREIGAVNTILFQLGKTKGFNTDVIGFEKSAFAFYPNEAKKKALVLGTGGASKAVQYVLNQKGFEFVVVSRKGNGSIIAYDKLSQSIINEYNLIINTSPVGMYPETSDMLPITNYNYTDNHYFFDLIYNPEKTATAILLESKGVKVKSGLEMLYLQAEASWEIWSEAIASC